MTSIFFSILLLILIGIIGYILYHQQYNISFITHTKIEQPQAEPVKTEQSQTEQPQSQPQPQPQPQPQTQTQTPSEPEKVEETSKKIEPFMDDVVYAPSRL